MGNLSFGVSQLLWLVHLGRDMVMWLYLFSRHLTIKLIVRAVEPVRIFLGRKPQTIIGRVMPTPGFEIDDKASILAMCFSIGLARGSLAIVNVDVGLQVALRGQRPPNQGNGGRRHNNALFNRPPGFRRSVQRVAAPI